MTHQPTEPNDNLPALERGLGLWQATSLNVANMVGIGPFITIPLFVAAMNGPQAMIGWVVAAVLVLCDGLVWSELGAALPGSGGSYHFLREIFGRYSWGRIVPFLFIWQFLVTGSLEMASGYVGGMDYLEYVFPNFDSSLRQFGVPGGKHCVAACSALVVTLLLCQKITHLGWMGVVFCAGTVVTVLTVIAAGLTHFDASLLALPPHALEINSTFAWGLGAAMTIAVYDYFGYYNICHLGDEVREPGKIIPRAVMISIVFIASVYLIMNVAILAVVPWQEVAQSKYIGSEFMERLFGRTPAMFFTGLVMWTALACLFAITLGYSRIPYAAAVRGDFFRPFAYLHPTGRFPLVSLLGIGLLTASFCFFTLQQLIDAAVCVRIVIQFIGQIIALHVLRTTRPDIQMPFRMWFYPLPSLVALAGWIFILVSAKAEILQVTFGVLVSGVLVFVVWRLIARMRREV